MKILLHYLQERWALLPVVCLLAAVAAGLFWLYGLPMGPLWYTLLVTGAVGVPLFLVPDYVRYRRRVRKLEAWREHAPSLLEAPALSGTLPETLLLDTASALCQELRLQEEAYSQRQRDALAYYTLWVHQVKTPIASMRLLLQSQPEGGSGAVAQELFKIERYVEMVLGYLRLETIASDLRLEACPVRPIVCRAAKKFAPQFIYKKLSLTIQEFPNQVVTDEKWLLFVLEQLLSNAVKYTRQGGVSISMGKDDVLLIQDTGVGIASEDLPLVFQRGFTGRNGRMDTTSTGLGLYLVKQVLDTLQTPVHICSSPGEGVQVRLYLHRGPAPRD